MQKGETKPSSKRIEHKRNWDIGISQLNHPANINIYIDVRRGRKIERLPLEAKIEAETIEQEDETMSETVEHKLKPWYGVDETKRETIEQKL